MKFENEWIEEAVRSVLGISADEELTAEAIKDIKYLKIGPSDHFINGYEIELSTHTPPIPFSDTDGGDEWICCLRGENRSWPPGAPSLAGRKRIGLRSSFWSTRRRGRKPAKQTATGTTTTTKRTR